MLYIYDISNLRVKVMCSIYSGSLSTFTDFFKYLIVIQMIVISTFIVKSQSLTSQILILYVFFPYVKITDAIE
jgi:hypothetical protein